MKLRKQFHLNSIKKDKYLKIKFELLQDYYTKNYKISWEEDKEDPSRVERHLTIMDQKT